MPTRNIVPRANGEGNIGTTNKKWKGIYADTVTVDNVEADTVTVDNVEADTATVGNVKANTVTVGNVDVFFMLLKRNKAYKVGDIAYSPNLPSWARLECVVAGTTGRTEPEFSSIEKGDMTNDGTTQFIVDDITDGIPVGDVAYRSYLKDGYLACNGQTVNRSDYPRLVELADKYSLWTADQSAEPWKFGQGNGSTTMLMPNYLERVVWGGTTAGKREAGLPNITGDSPSYWFNNINDLAGGWKALTDFTVGWGAGGVHTWSNNSGDIKGSPNNLAYDGKFIFDASRSNAIYGKSSTVQPPAIVLIPQMKY